MWEIYFKGGLLNGSPLICGGKGSDIYLSECYKYNKTLRTWELHASLKTKRSNRPSSVMIQDTLWIVGGANQGYMYKVGH